MTNRKRTALIMVPLFLVGLSTGAAWGQQGEGKRVDGPRFARADGGKEKAGGKWHGRKGKMDYAKGKGNMVKGMTRKLELTDEQMKKIKNVLTDARKKRISLRANARVAQIELKEMISQETVDGAKIGAKVDEISKIKSDMLRAKTDAALAVRAVLTAEQLAKADGMLKRLLKGGKGKRDGKGRGRW